MHSRQLISQIEENEIVVFSDLSPAYFDEAITMKTHLLSLCCAVVLFSLLTHVTWSVGKEETSRPRTAKEISQEVKRHLQAQRFTDAEKLLNAILTSKTISVNGTRVLEEVYDQLAASKEASIYSAWCETSKNSHFPLVVRGNAFLEEASTLRGTDYAKHVTESRWERIRELLRQAQSDFEAAHALQPSDPESASRMIRVNLLRNHPAEVIEKWFKKAVQADSSWLGAYREKFYCTLANWGGSEKEMMDFMRSCAQNSPKGSIVYTIPFEYLKMSMPRHQSIGTMYLVDTGNEETLHLIENGIKRYRKDFPRSPWPDYYQGVLNQANANMQEAVADYGKALDKDPDNTVTLKARVMTQYALGRLDKAETDLERIVQIEPDAAFGYANLGAIQFHLHNNIEKGLELYAKAFTIEKDPSILKSYFFDLAELLGNKKRYSDAIQYYTKHWKQILNSARHYCAEEKPRKPWVIYIAQLTTCWNCNKRTKNTRRLQKSMPKSTCTG
jgi:tetratricopeptide (TPR) repeat protein